MYIIGENIHIISPKVKEAIAARDGAFFVDLARKQVQNGAKALDLNVGPQKKAGTEVVPWLVEVVQEAVGQDFTLSLDTTNLEAIKAGLKKIPRGKAIINSTSAEPENWDRVAEAWADQGLRVVLFARGVGGGVGDGQGGIGTPADGQHIDLVIENEIGCDLRRPVGV